MTTKVHGFKSGHRRTSGVSWVKSAACLSWGFLVCKPSGCRALSLGVRSPGTLYLVYCSAAAVLKFLTIIQQGSICILHEALPIVYWSWVAVKMEGGSALKLLAQCRHQVKIQI